MQTLAVIPARMGSSRLPGKPLADIHGVPMVVHAARRAREADIGPVVVAAAEEVIADACARHGVDAVLTDPGLPSGSDRVEAALRFIEARGTPPPAIVVNLQGDMPSIAPATVRAAVDALAEDPVAAIGTCAVPVAGAEEAERPHTVKAVLALADGHRTGRALYFSRAPVPWGQGAKRFHHIGVYAFRRGALVQFVGTPPTALERSESLEQLRALEIGLAISCTVVDGPAPFGVDTPEDLERARAALAPE